MTATERYYDENAEDEWNRLDRHRMEFAVTLKVFKDYLPTPPASVVDVGGGPGRYSIILARQGYGVTLVDLSNACIEFAKKKARENKIELAGYIHSNATHLPDLANESFDVALLMGPLYHLTLDSDRKLAIGESKRILKRNGLMFASFITRYAPVRWAARYEPASLYHVEFSKRILETGVWNARDDAYRFGKADSYFARPSEVKPLMESMGFETLTTVGCESAVSMVDEKVNELSGDLFDAWVEVAYSMGKDPDAYGASEHLLYIGRKS